MSTFETNIINKIKIVEHKISLLENENKTLRLFVEAISTGTTTSTVSTVKAAKEYQPPGSTTTAIPGGFVNPNTPRPPSSKRPIIGVSGAIKSPTTFGGTPISTNTSGPIDANPTFPETPETPKTPGVSVGGINRTPVTQGRIPTTTISGGGINVNPTFPNMPGTRKPGVSVGGVARAPVTFDGGSPSTTTSGTSVNANPTIPTGTNVPGTQPPPQAPTSILKKSGTTTKDVSSLAGSRYIPYK